jgi:drug/metabolite transporter (DMT)-like permease
VYTSRPSVAWHPGSWNVWRVFGDALFLCAAFLTACFTVLMRRSRLDPLHAAALVATGSMVIYLPFYLAMSTDHLARIPLPDLAAQLIFQGIFVTVVGVVLYGRAVNMLGASRGAAFGALVPVLSGVFAIPLLGEWPGAAGWIGIVLSAERTACPVPCRELRFAHR